ncbi:MAG: hypothetical protein HY697_04770 [Deltaproteobacteria bacterium]|nr:hypothetical protein [Deltaproteobacteria bacterium]
MAGPKKLSVLTGRGAVTSGCLAFLLLVLALGYLGFHFGGAYWDYLQARQKIREALNWAAAGAPKTEAEMARRVVAKVREAGVELSTQSIRFQQDPDLLTITVSWIREVELPYYTYPWRFQVVMTEEKRWSRGF